LTAGTIRAAGDRIVKPEVLEYGFRSRRSGKFVRLDEQLLDDGYDNGASLERCLTFDEGYPILQETDLRAIVAFRYGNVILNTLGHDFIAPPGFDVEDLEAVEFSTREVPSSGGAATRFVTDVRTMHFDIIRNVELDQVPRKGEGAMSLTSVFGREAVSSMLETVGRSDASWLNIVALKGDPLDYDPEELVGKVVVCGPTIRPLSISGAHGVVGTRSIDGTTYLAVVYGCSYPFFYTTEVSLEIDGGQDLKWDDLKVSFGFDGSNEQAANLLREIWDGQEEDEGLWPAGWAFHEISGFESEMTAVFSVAGPLINEDAALVRASLRYVEAGHDIRPEPHSFAGP
jgi:hypothetical protein